jgi:predicted DNA binding CopG/RHH family protein
VVKRLFSSRRLVKVYLEESDFQAIQHAASKLGFSVSRWIRELIDSVLR